MKRLKIRNKLGRIRPRKQPSQSMPLMVAFDVPSIEDIEEDFEFTKEEYAHYLKKREDEVAFLEEQVKDLKTLLDNKNTVIQALNDESKVLKTQVAYLTAEEETIDLPERIKTKDSYISELEHKVATQRATLVGLENQLKYATPKFTEWQDVYYVDRVGASIRLVKDSIASVNYNPNKPLGENPWYYNLEKTGTAIFYDEDLISTDAPREELTTFVDNEIVIYREAIKKDVEDSQLSIVAEVNRLKEIEKLNKEVEKVRELEAKRVKEEKELDEKLGESFIVRFEYSSFGGKNIMFYTDRKTYEQNLSIAYNIGTLGSSLYAIYSRKRAVKLIRSEAVRVSNELSHFRNVSNIQILEVDDDYNTISSSEDKYAILMRDNYFKGYSTYYNSHRDDDIKDEDRAMWWFQDYNVSEYEYEATLLDKYKAEKILEDIKEDGITTAELVKITREMRDNTRFVIRLFSFDDYNFKYITHIHPKIQTANGPMFGLVNTAAYKSTAARYTKEEVDSIVNDKLFQEWLEEDNCSINVLMVGGVNYEKQ